MPRIDVLRISVLVRKPWTVLYERLYFARGQSGTMGPRRRHLTTQ